MNARCPKDAEGAPEAVFSQRGSRAFPVTGCQGGDVAERGGWEDDE